LKRALFVTALCCFAPACPAQDVERPDLPQAVGSAVISVDVRATFLRTQSETVAKDSPAIDLAKLGLKAGDLIQLEVLGEFSWSQGELPEDTTLMIGIFSSSATLLPANQLNRVAGALDVGPEAPTGFTLFGGFATDIPQDFLIGSSKVRIPAGARFLFVAAPDVFYSDNADPDGNYALRITVL